MLGMRPPTVLVVIDPTCQRPPDAADIARTLSAGAAVIAVVLWPPPALTLNIRLLLWQARHRALTTEDLIDLTRRTVDSVRPDDGSVTVSGYAYQCRRTPLRLADAIAELCRIHHPTLVVLPDGAITDASERVRAALPEDLAITLAKPMNTRYTLSPPVERRGGTITMGGCRRTAITAVAILAVVAAMNLTAVAASVSPLIGLAALPITMIGALILIDAVHKKLAPESARAFRGYCRGIVTYLRADR